MCKDPKWKVQNIFFKTKLFFLQILAAMQKELAASGLSPEEILAKTLLLQVPSESDEDDEPPAKPVKKPAPKNSPGKIKLMSNTASPFPKAPPPVEGEEDSDDGFQSPATPSEDEDDEWRTL